VHTNNDQVSVNITQKIWDKTRDIIRRIRVKHESLHAENEGGGGGLAGGPTLGMVHKQLERNMVFPIHVSQACPSMVPYFKGINLTLDNGRAGRYNQGWKCLRALMEQLRRGGDP
jgi:hypothetical protein